MASFAYGDGSLLRFNVRQFDSKIPFEQLFFSILPSSIFVVTSAWRVAARHKPRPSVAAPVLQRVKAVSWPEACPLRRLIRRIIGYHRDIHCPTTGSSGLDGGRRCQQRHLPHCCVCPQARGCAVPASRQLAQSQQKPATFDIAHHLSFADHGSGCHPGQDLLSLITRQT